MRLIPTLLLSAITLIQTAKAEVAYNGLVMTSIDVKDIGNGKVEFSGQIKGTEDDTTAVILKNVERVRWTGWRRHIPVFQAEKVSDNQIKKSKLKPLLCIHGFNVQPEGHMKTCRRVKDKFEKFTLIPVIWPSGGGLMNYFSDRGYSKGAGEALKNSMSKYAGMFPRKSILAHSMGNRVFRHAADPKFRFDNIFMAAADVNEKIFDKDYIDSSAADSDDGLSIRGMLNHGNSKIYVLHNRQDYALAGSTVQKLGVGRLGQGGVKQNRLHEKLKQKVENLNCGQKWLNWGINFAAHSYQFDDEAIKFYDDKCI